MKILIVDDDRLVLESVRHFLKREGYEVITADNGVKALEIAEFESPDMVISDVMMPGVSGLSLLNILKSFYLNKIPVILISSFDKSDMILSSMGLGAVGFLSKPIDFTELSRIIRKHLHPAG